MKIYSPVKEYDGEAAGLNFKNGVAEVEAITETVKDYFKRKGYTIEGEEQPPQTAESANPIEPTETTAPTEPDELVEQEEPKEEVEKAEPKSKK